MEPFVTYHGVDAATHQQRFDTLAEQGLRPVWVDVRGPAGDARYAAVWVPDDGRAWFALHGLDAAEFRQRLDELTLQGFVATVLSSTGATDAEVFAAVFERRDPECCPSRAQALGGSDTGGSDTGGGESRSGGPPGGAG